MARPRRLTPGSPPERASATIVDVARDAGVSRQTVTRAMNDMPGISAVTKARVLASADDLAYRPSRFGRGLVSGGVKQLGLVVNDLTNPYSPELAAAVVRVAAEAGWNVMLADVGLSSETSAIIENLGSQVDVVVGYFGSRSSEWFELLGRVPVVELDPVDVPQRSAVLIDPSAAIEDLADHFVEVGVGHPAILDASSPGRPSARSDLLARALQRRGYLPQLVRVEESTSEAAAVRTEVLLAGHRRLDAIVAFNDLMAIGALSACIRADVEVPDRVRVVGIDGLSIGRYLTPTLTTLDVDFDAVGRNALELAVGITSGALPLSGPGAVRRVEHSLLLRESA